MQPTERIAARPLDGGFNDNRNPILLRDGESPDLENVDLNRSSVASSGGAVKMGNRAAPRAALLTRVDPGLSPLPLRLEVGQMQSVPVRGYGSWRYRKEYDIGGDFVEDTGSGTYHARRGRSFDVNVSFQVPLDEKFSKDQVGSAAGAATNFLTRNIHLDECFTIIQKGGNVLHAMSWALAVVNVGSAAVYNAVTGGAFGEKTSTYLLCWIWFDSAEWSVQGGTQMRYLLSNGTINGATGDFSTVAMRCIVTNQAIEPGRSYSVSAALDIDSGSQGTGATPTTAWNHDGSFAINVIEDGGPVATYSFVDSSGGGTATGMAVWKGPTDSMRYFAKYGVRFSSKSRIYAGLGYRFAPWIDGGNIPFGVDAAPLEKGGFSKVDFSALDAASSNTLFIDVTDHAANDAYVVVTNQYLTTGITRAAHASPTGPFAGGPPPVAAVWGGLGSGGVPQNPEALRGYRLVQYGDAAAAIRGGWLSILNYTEVGASFRLNVVGGTSIATAWTNDRAFLVGMRWFQRQLKISELRIYSQPRNYIDPRVEWSLKTQLDLDDTSEPDLENLLFYSPLDDGEGGVLRELVSGFDGFTSPFSFAVGQRGQRGPGQLWLSGEGEALQLDLSENPIVTREMIANLKGGLGGFAVEMTVVFPEAIYGMPVDDPGSSAVSDFIAQFASDVCSWEIKDPESDGFQTEPKPLMIFGFHARDTSGFTTAYRKPLGFQLEVAEGSDQLDTRMRVEVGAFAPNWDVENTPWVGEAVTIQFGIHPTAVDTFSCYIAASPKKLFLSAAGDTSDSEFAYFVSRTIAKKDIDRAVVTVGGRWRPGTLGYSELNCCMLIDEVRVFGTVAPGKLPAVAGQQITDRSGKLLGANAYPPRELSPDELLHDLGAAISTANVVDGSDSVAAPGETAFFTADPALTIEAVKSTFLLIAGDDHQVLSPATTGIVQEEFYFIESVAADGSTLNLATPYNGQTRTNASTKSFRMLGYTAFRDDVYGRALSLASGSTFRPGTTLTGDATITSDLFFNLAPVTANWRMRIYSPLSSASSAEIVPGWTGGFLECRRNPILGMASVQNRLFAGAGSCVFEVDDRWRTGRVGRATVNWLSFRSLLVGSSGVRAPLAEDRVEFTSTAGVELSEGAFELGAVALTRTWDFEVELDDVRGIHTVLWVGSASSNPTVVAGTGTSEHRLNHWIRINDGRVEFIVGSSVTSNSGVPAPSGYFVAVAKRSIRANERTHVRLQVACESTATNWLQKPLLKINGKTVEMIVDTTEVGAAGLQWIHSVAIASAGVSPRILLGCGRDAYEETQEAKVFAQNVGKGIIVPSTLLQGYLHALRGRLRKIVIGYDTAANLAAFPNFNPDAITYAASFSKTFNCQLDEGVGHKVYDSAGTRYGLIRSHPFIPVFCEMGLRDRPFAFAPYQNQLYATNGGRPMVWDPRFGGRFAGVLPPNTKPDFEVERKPLWEPNVFVAANPENGPIKQAADPDKDPICHYSTFGNNFLVQNFHKEMNWEKGDSLVFKCYVRFRDVSGRIPIYSTRVSTTSGGLFIECRDGRLVIGWYDTFQKAEQIIDTTAPVFSPGHVYYVFVQKRFPQKDSLGDSWDSSVPGLITATNTFAEAPWLSMTLTGVGTPYKDGMEIVSGATQGYVMFADTFNASAATQLLHVRMTSNNANLTAGAATSIPVGSGGVVPVVGSQFPLPRDRAIVRVFPKSAVRETLFDAKTGGTIRNCVSFTSLPSPTGCTASGLVTRSSATYTVAGAGATGTVTASVGVFVPDHVGMYWQPGAGTNAGKVWLVVGYTGPTVITVGDPVGGSFVAAGGVNDAVARAGGVFIGVSMRKSEGVASSTQPDDAVYDIEAFGSQLSGNPTNGVAPFNGEFWSFGWVSTNRHDIIRTAATDPNETATDVFQGTGIYGATPPGALDFSYPAATNLGQNFTVVDAVNYSGGPLVPDYTIERSTQPNEDLEVETIPTAPALSTSSASADALTWRGVRDVDVLEGTRRIRTTFLDVDQDVESNPSPELLITPSNEDRSNPSGTARILLTDIPISPDRGQIHRRIYMTLGDGATPLLVATIPDNSSTSFSIFIEEGILASGPPIRFDRNPPPRCAIVAESQGALFYADLQDPLRQPDGVVFSNPFRPASVPLTNFLIFSSGEEAPITGMHDLDGRMIVGKQDVIYAIRVEPGVAVYDTITRGAGFATHNAIQALDDRLYFLDPRGPFALPSFGQPIYLGTKVEGFFSSQADPSWMTQWAAAINRRRDQYVFIAKQVDHDYSERRFGIEYDHELSGLGAEQKSPSKHRFTRYRGPNLTSIGSAKDRSGGSPRLVGGTEEGYAVWLDRSDTKRLMLGPNEGIHGAASLIVAAGSSSTYIPINSGTLDVSFSGPRGAVARWLSSSGVEQRAVVLFATTTRLYLDMAIANLPLTGAALILGAARPKWASKWFDNGNPAENKKNHFLDVTRTVKATGILKAVTRRDFLPTVVDQEVPGKAFDLDLTKAFEHRSVQVQGRALQVELSERFVDSGLDFEITDVVIRQDVASTAG